MTVLSATSFRVAEPSDALCIGVLGMQVFLDNYAKQGIRPAIAREVLSCFSTDTIAELLESPSRTFVLAEHDGHLIGFAQLAFHASQELVPFAPAAELKRLYVQEPYTSRGIGKALLAQAEMLAATRGMAGIWLTTWIGNTRARNFYPRQGYADHGMTYYVFENEKHENRVFAKTLSCAAAA